MTEQSPALEAEPFAVTSGDPLATARLSTLARVRAILASSSGNLVEWYDFYVYAFGAIYFAPAFFPSGDPTSQLLSTAGVFAVGFLMRPIGGWFFGRYADRRGRRASLLLSVLLMCSGSLVIAVLPTAATLGRAAAVILLLARLLQGFSVGGEYGTSATYMSEVALEGRRGFYASFQYVTLIGGQLLAVLSMLLLQQVLPPDAMRGWGWRIPFALGAVLALSALWLRRSLPESIRTTEATRRNAGSLALLRRNGRAFWQVVGLTAGGSLAFYTWTTYMQKYLVNTAGMDARTASWVMTLALFVTMATQPLFGALSDVIGRRTSLLCFGVLSILATVPLLDAIAAAGHTPWTALLLVMGALGINSFYTSITGLVKAEMFPTEVRALGVGLAYAVANSVFGGSAEYVALWLKSAGVAGWFGWYATAMTAVTLLVVLGMRDTGRHGFLREN
jgi:MHS family alpha-ketoglutarate permease-like MFS transporter